MEKSNTFYAKEGEVLTCENGHEICEFSRDVDRLQVVRATDFTNFRNDNVAPTPDNYVGELACNICDSDYIRANSHHITQCFVNGVWRQ